VPLHQSLLRRGATTEAAGLVVVVPDCPTGHSTLLHGPQALPGPAVALLMTQIAAPAVVAGLVGRVVAIAGTDDLFQCSTRGGLEKCVSLLLCRRRSRQRVAAGASWCTVTWYW
jgi:hypothetical protein